MHYPWITSRSSLKELRRKNGSTERYVVLPLLPPNKNSAAHVTIMNDKTGVKRSGRAASTRKQWHTEPLEGWTLCPTRDDRKQAYAEAFQLAQLVSTGVQPKIASKKRACPNWQKDPHCLQHAVLAHLCRACLGKQNFEVCAFDEERTRRFHDWLGFTRGQCTRDALSICCEPGLPLQRRGLAQGNGQDRDTPCNRFQGRRRGQGDRWRKA